MLRREVIEKYIDHPEFRKALPELKIYFDRYDTRRKSCSSCEKVKLGMNFKNLALKLSTDAGLVEKYNAFIDKHGSPSERAELIVDNKKVNYQRLKIDVPGFIRLLPLADIRKLLFLHFPSQVERAYKFIDKHGFDSKESRQPVEELYDSVYASKDAFEDFFKFVTKNKLHMDLYQNKLKLFKINSLRGKNLVDLENMLNEFLIDKDLISMTIDNKLPVATVVYQ